MPGLASIGSLAVAVIQLGTMERVYLGLGSNVGDRSGNLEKALAALSGQIAIEIVSSIYETEPVGYEAQDWFLNLVCCGKTELDPEALLAFTKSIEKGMGRQEAFRNAPRIIDIDILFYGDRIIKTEELIIPHPRITERAFVLVPLAQIAPGFIHPVNGKSISKLLSELDGTKQVRGWPDVSRIG